MKRDRRRGSNGKVVGGPRDFSIKRSQKWQIQTEGRLARKDEDKGAAAIACGAVEGRVYGLERTRKGKRRSGRRAEQRKKLLNYRRRTALFIIIFTMQN